MIFYVWLISFFVLVDEVMKNKNRLHDFLYDVFRLQGKKGKTKMKNNNKKQTNYYVIFSFFVTSSTKTKNKKWNEPNISHAKLLSEIELEPWEEKHLIWLVRILKITGCPEKP